MALWLYLISLTWFKRIRRGEPQAADLAVERLSVLVHAVRGLKHMLTLLWMHSGIPV